MYNPQPQLVLLHVLRHLRCEDLQTLPVFGWVGIPSQPRSRSVSTILGLHMLSLVACLCHSLPALVCRAFTTSVPGDMHGGEKWLWCSSSPWDGWLTCIFPPLCQQMQGCKQL